MSALALNTLDAEFHGVHVRLIDHAGQRWLTAEDVGRCHGYAAAHARTSIQKLFSRHTDEFSEADTCVVNLTTQGQGRECRLFSSTGCVLLSMFANTAQAKAFRAWAKWILTAAPPAPAESAPAPV